MDSADVVANYQLLAVLTGQMREAAARGEWDHLTDIERRRGELVASMQVPDAEVTLDEAARQYKARLIADVMAGDVEIRRHIQVWMDQLQHSMQSNRQEQRVLKAYGA